jgi:hypothetical protein
LAIDSSIVLADYDENEVFNNYLDYYTEEVVISNITIDASRALFTDEEAYKARFQMISLPRIESLSHSHI